jgi:ATP-dependent RNA helicase RhlE
LPAPVPADYKEQNRKMTFESLGLAPEIMRELGELGYNQPTPIQEQAIPLVLAGRDLLGCAQTGTGKTAAFALPILHALRGTEPGHLRALVLVPTRELAIQVGRNFREYGAGLALRSSAVYGGVPSGPQEIMLRGGVDILVATPGRLKDHMWRGLVDFGQIRYLVLDEADRMLDMGFIDAVREIVREIPQERQSMLFSATLEPEILKLARGMLRNPARCEASPASTAADGVEHRILRVNAGDKKEALIDLLGQSGMDRTLVFTRTRRGASQLASHLRRAGYRVASIHSDRTQAERIAALEGFRAGRIEFLVATDIAARGIDVEGISHVVNYDMPHSPDDYVHRTGRTARAGRSGTAISLATPADAQTLRLIENRLGRRLGTEAEPSQVPNPSSGRAAAAGRPQRVSRSGSQTGSSDRVSRADSHTSSERVSRAGSAGGRSSSRSSSHRAPEPGSAPTYRVRRRPENGRRREDGEGIVRTRRTESAPRPLAAAAPKSREGSRGEDRRPGEGLIRRLARLFD